MSEAPQHLSMTDFLAVADSYGGFAKSCRFAVRILPTGTSGKLAQYSSFMRDFTYLCEATEFPGRGFEMMDLRYYGPKFKLPYAPEYGDLSMTFLVRSNSIERQIFDDWMEIINPSTTYDFTYRDEYCSEITLFQYTEAPSTGETEGFGGSEAFSFETANLSEGPTGPSLSYEWTLYEAYPMTINAQPVTWADDNFQRLVVNFTHSRWRRKNRDSDSGQYNLIGDPNVSTDDWGKPGVLKY